MRPLPVSVVLAAVALGVGTTACSASSEEPARAGGATPPGSHFRLSPPGAKLPSARRCGMRVRTSTWEPRPGNYRANHRMPARRVRLGHPDFDARWNRRYAPRITGRFVGTTDEIIQWAACKWGLSDDLLRAQAKVESSWRQDAEGDLERRANGNCTVHDRGDPCPTSFGLLQNKWYFNARAYPRLRIMTAFHMDWSAAQLRGCYDGREDDLPRGDYWACLGDWFSGGEDHALAEDYVGRVRVALREKAWRGWRDRGREVPYRPDVTTRG
jgi:hypothetical protein